MALKDSQGVPLQPARKEAGGTGAPRWVLPIYLLGLVLIYLGQRALTALESGGLLTWCGLVAVASGVLVRLSPRFSGRGSQRPIEKLMLGLSLLGVVALGVYYLTTESGQALIGLDQAAEPTRTHALGVLQVAWISLLALAAVPLIFAEIARVPMRHAERPEVRRVFAAAVSGAVLSMAAIYGSLLVFTAGSVDLEIDYSYFKTSQPSESTRKLTAQLEDNVRITAFFPAVNEVRSEVESYLTALSRDVPKLQVEVVDRLLEPRKARDLRATQDGVIVATKGNVSRSLLVGADIEEARKKLKTLDRDFQELLLKVARARRKAYFTVGHGELNERSADRAADQMVRGLTQFVEKQNYSAEDLGLAQGLGREIPDDADLVLILAPARPFAAEEIAALERYAKRGGKLFMALDPDTRGGQEADSPEENQAGLERLAAVVGLRLDPTLLANEKLHVVRRQNDSDRIMIQTASFSSHPSVTTLSRHAPSSAIVLSGSGSLTKAEAADPDRKIDFTIRSAAGTFADENGNYARDAEEKAKGYNLAAAVARKVGSDEPKEGGGSKKKDDSGPGDAKMDSVRDEMRAFVLADGDLLSDMFLIGAPNNRYLIVDAMRWLGGEESIVGEVNTEEDVRIEHTKKEDQVWFYSTIFGVPALVLGAGLALGRVSRRRTQRKTLPRKASGAGGREPSARQEPEASNREEPQKTAVRHADAAAAATDEKPEGAPPGEHSDQEQEGGAR